MGFKGNTHIVMLNSSVARQGLAGMQHWKLFVHQSIFFYYYYFKNIFIALWVVTPVAVVFRLWLCHCSGSCIKSPLQRSGASWYLKIHVLLGLTNLRLSLFPVPTPFHVPFKQSFYLILNVLMTASGGSKFQSQLELSYGRRCNCQMCQSH